MSEWTKEWPKKAGDYWFYGWEFGRMKNIYTGEPIPPELCHVKVKKCVNGLIFVTNGHFFYKAEGAIGIFSKVDMPIIPDFFEKEFIKKT